MDAKNPTFIPKSRRHIVLKQNWAFFLAIATSLAIAAGNEIIEWWFAMAVKKTAPVSLGMQGDIWDTQWDMMLDLTGAMATIAIGSIHDRQMRGVNAPCRNRLASILAISEVKKFIGWTENTYRSA